MPWSAEPPTTAQNTQDFGWHVQPLLALREKNQFRFGSTAPTPANYGEEPAGPRRKWPRSSEPAFFGTVGTFSEGQMIDPDAIGKWDNSGPNPFLAGESAHDWDKGPWSLLVETNADADIHIAYNQRFEIQGIDETTGMLTLHPTRDALTSKELDAYGTLANKNYIIVPRYGLGWFERWPVPPNPTREEFCGLVDWRADRQPTHTKIYLATSLPDGIGCGYFSQFYDSNNNCKAIPGTFNATDPNDPNTAQYELFVWDTQAIKLQHRVPIKTAGGDTVEFWSAGSGASERTVEWLAGSYTTGSEATPWLAAFGDPSSVAPYLFAIIAKGGVYRLDKERYQPHCWYRGTGMSSLDPAVSWGRAYAHQPDDALRQVKIATANVLWKDGSDWTICDITDETPHPAFDVDLWSDPENVCSAPDRPYARDYWKSPRAWQKAIEDLIPSFVEDIDYTGKDAIPWFVLAEGFRAAGVNASVCTVGTISSTLTIGGFSPSNFGFTGTAGDNPEYPILVNYAIRYYPAGEVLFSGSAQLTNATTLALDLSGQTSDVKAAIAGKEIVLSPGWTQYVPLEFRHPYPRWVWIPDVDQFDVLIPTAVLESFDDFGLNGRGSWVERLPDTAYTELSAKGDGTLKTFAANEISRFVGDNFHEPVDGGSPDAFPMDQVLPYWDRFNVSIHAEPAQTQKVTSLYSGTAVAVGPKRIEVASPLWFAYWHSEGLTRTDTGTCSGGSATGFDDSTKLATEESGAFWESERFPTGRTAYELFVTQLQDDAGTWHRRLIRSTTLSPTTGAHATLDSADPLPFADPTGHAYKIPEPFEANRWRGRPVKLSWPDGTVEWNRVEANDDIALFLLNTPTKALEVGVTFEIMNLMPGGVGRMVSTEPASDAQGNRVDYIPMGSLYWVPITGGADTARLGVSSPVDFHKDPRENLPGIVRRFGKLVKGQYIGKTFYAEMRKVLDKLTAFKTTDIGWHSRLDPLVEEKNFKSAGGGSTGYDHGEDPTDTTIDIWNNFAVPEFQADETNPYTVEDTSPIPHASASANAMDSVDGIFFGATISCETTTAYAYVGGTATPIVSSTAKLYVKAGMDGGDSEPGQTPPDADVSVVPNDPPPYPTLEPLDGITSTAFADLGTGLIFRKFKSFALGSLDANNIRKSGKIGDPSIPPIPEPPPYLSLMSGGVRASTYCTSGFYVLDQIAVVSATGLEFHA